MADYRERYDVLGTVTSQHAYTREELAVRAMWLLYEMHPSEGRRDGYCKAQVPLRLLTLGVWSFLPFNWACLPKYPQEDENFALHIDGMKRVVAAAGGNLLILSRTKDSKYLSVMGGTSLIWVTEETVANTQIFGFAVRVNARAAEPANTAPPHGTSTI